MTPAERLEVASSAAIDAVVTQAPGFIADLDTVGVAELRALLLAAWTRGARFMAAEMTAGEAQEAQEARWAERVRRPVSEMW